jgi:hypothetical protein
MTMKFDAVFDSEKPPVPTTIEEARQEGMGFVRGVIDMALSFSPRDPKVSARAALVAYAGMVEHVARQQYGAEAWDAFTKATREYDAATKRGAN